jgi:hypothetical protein
VATQSCPAGFVAAVVKKYYFRKAVEYDQEGRQFGGLVVARPRAKNSPCERLSVAGRSVRTGETTYIFDGAMPEMADGLLLERSGLRSVRVQLPVAPLVDVSLNDLAWGVKKIPYFSCRVDTARPVWWAERHLSQRKPALSAALHSRVWIPLQWSQDERRRAYYGHDSRHGRQAADVPFATAELTCFGGSNRYD